MFERHVSDWDDAYANGANIAGSERWPQAWAEAAQAYRQSHLDAGTAQLDIAYGPQPRSRLDLFLPEAEPRGLMVFIHGGYWMAFDKSAWSHLAAGAVDRGFAVAMPSYTLCPAIRIAGITREVGAAIETAAGRVAGPVALCGHSAGGHLVTRMICIGAPLRPAVQARIRNVVSVSGLHDLRPLMSTRMNGTLRLDESEARQESPALLRPMKDARITCWVGGGERGEFRRQSALLANVWTGLGAATACVEEPDRHHFTIIDGLQRPDHALTRALLSEAPVPNGRTGQAGRCA